jgi:transposase
MESVKARVHRSVSEKRRIVERTLEPGVSVARVAQEEGVNANHIFLWRRSYCTNKLPESIEHFSALLPVVISATESEHLPEQPGADIPSEATPCTGAIHIEIHGKAMISVESGADLAVLRTVLESLRK